MNKIIFLIIFFFLCAVILLIVFLRYFGPAGNSSKKQVFIVPQNETGFDVGTSLKEKKLIKNQQSFQFLLNTFAKDKKTLPGGYRIAQNMNAWQVFRAITSKSDLAWVTVSGCIRKEQVGEKLMKALGFLFVNH